MAKRFGQISNAENELSKTHNINWSKKCSFGAKECKKGNSLPEKVQLDQNAPAIY